MARRRLTIQEAAQELGTTVDALRSRVRRGTVDSEKGEDGRVFVWLGTDQATDQAPPSQDAPKAQVGGSGTAPLIEELRRQNEYLREQLEAEREARAEESRRKDHIIAALVNRIPELEPGAPPAERPEPSEAGGPQDAPQTGQEGPGRVDIPQDQTRPGEGHSEGHRRPWWRRIFG